jgi:hypothetical protein
MVFEAGFSINDGKELLMQGIPTTVTVSGVVMEITEEWVSCLSGVEITTSVLRDGKPIPDHDSSLTCSDLSGRFKISDIVTNPDELQLSFGYNKSTFTDMTISTDKYSNELSVNVIVEYVRQPTDL